MGDRARHPTIEADPLVSRVSQSANYIVLLALSRKATLTPQATHALVLSVLNAAHPNGQMAEKVAVQLVSTVLGLLQSQDEVPDLGSDVIKQLSKTPNFGKLMAETAEKYEMSKAMRPILKGFVTKLVASCLVSWCH